MKIDAWTATHPASLIAELTPKEMDGFAIQDKVTDGSPSARRIGVVGAGIAGLTAGQVLQNQGYEVRVFDKARGVGGRMPVRRHGAFAFDHGAQYFTAKDPRFSRCVERWVDSGVVARWQGRIAAIGDGARRPDPSTIRFVGIPGMNAVARHLAIGLDVVSQLRVSHLTQTEAGWRLTSDADDDLGIFDAIVIAAPAAQATELLATADKSDTGIRECHIAPCWAVMLGFDGILNLPFDGAFVNNSALSWIARNNSKPERSDGESWVLHAGPDWSSAHLERSSEDVIVALTSEFGRLTGLGSLRPSHRDAHRWRYALPPEPLGAGCFSNQEERWVVCGDWCHGGRIEGAFLSGLAAAEQLIGPPNDVTSTTRTRAQ